MRHYRIYLLSERGEIMSPATEWETTPLSWSWPENCTPTALLLRSGRQLAGWLK